jgi:hypothetical protein
MTVELGTDSGRTVRTPPDQPFLTPDGWQPAGDLRSGDGVFVNGGKGGGPWRRKTQYYYRADLIHHPYAARRNVRPGGMSVPSTA